MNIETHVFMNGIATKECELGDGCTLSIFTNSNTERVKFTYYERKTWFRWKPTLLIEVIPTKEKDNDQAKIRE